MNDRFKFRAWDGQQMQYFTIGHSGLYFNDNGLCPGIVAVMQYTGLKDKNGKEIYEGDIIRLRQTDEDGEFYFDPPMEVESLEDFFESKGYCERELGENWSSENIEIIGNI